MPEVDCTVRYADIPGFPGYKVGTDGSVWSCRIKGQSRMTDHWRQLKTIVAAVGYLQVSLVRRRGKAITCHVHRLVLEAFVGPCPEGMEACHFPDQSRTNARLDNLRWDTQEGNAADMAEHGTKPQGERNSQARLTDAVVREARRRYAAGGTTFRELAVEYGVSEAAVGMAVRRATWKHVT